MSDQSDVSSIVSENKARRKNPYWVANRDKALDDAYSTIRRLRQEVARAKTENGVLQNLYNHLLKEKKKDEDLIKTLTGGNICDTSVEKTGVTEPTLALDGDGQGNPEKTNQEVAESSTLVLHPSPSPATEVQLMSREDLLVNRPQDLGGPSSSGVAMEVEDLPPPSIEFNPALFEFKESQKRSGSLSFEFAGEKVFINEEEDEKEFDLSENKLIDLIDTHQKIITKSREKTKFFKVLKSAADSLNEDLTAKQLKIQEQQEELARLKAELSTAQKERAELELTLAAQPKLTKDDLDEFELLKRDVPSLRENAAKAKLEAEEKAKALSVALREKDALKAELDAAKIDSDLLLTEKEEAQVELMTLKGENTSLIQSARAVCQFTWPAPKEMPGGPLPATLAQVPEALRVHCKSVAEYAARHSLGVVKSLYPKIDLASCKKGYAKGTTIERANQLSMEASSCAEELVKDVPLSP
ncbi:hypothetical protein EJB05_11022, partial [Eragrostis curvula]